MQPDAIEGALRSPEFRDELAAVLASGKGKREDTSVSAAGRDLRDGAKEDPKPDAVPWPAPIDEAAYYGLAGDIVRTLEPQTEADPVALLIHVLVGVGSLVGRGPHFRVGGDESPHQ